MCVLYTNTTLYVIYKMSLKYKLLYITWVNKYDCIRHTDAGNINIFVHYKQSNITTGRAV